jgi:hypothetical protein
MRCNQFRFPIICLWFFRKNILSPLSIPESDLLSLWIFQYQEARRESANLATVIRFCLGVRNSINNKMLAAVLSPEDKWIFVGATIDTLACIQRHKDAVDLCSR